MIIKNKFWSKKVIYKYAKILLPLFFIFIFLSIYFADRTIEKSTEQFVYDNISKIPHNKTGLLLGTTKYLKNGRINPYFLYRIKAATELYNAKKVDLIIVSGDNSVKGYNEPFDMKNELLKNNIPDSVIILDYAGFRTYDSVIRANKIFGQKKFTVISQQFHNKRAIYIAQKFGLNTLAYNAKDVKNFEGIKTNLREKFARVKVFIDLIINKKPKFLEKKLK